MVTENMSIYREMKKRSIFKIAVFSSSESVVIKDTSTASHFAKFKMFTAFFCLQCHDSHIQIEIW